MLKTIPERYLQPLYRVESIRKREQASFAKEGESYAMMERAGQALYRHILQHNPKIKHLSVVVGSGNNGGDGLVVAALAAKDGVSVRVYDCASSPRIGDAKRAEREVLSIDEIVIEKECSRLVCDPAGVVVDALLGIGFRSPLRQDYLVAIEALNEKRASGAWVISVDCPSGLDANSGAADNVVESDLVVTFIGDKIGHHLQTGAVRCRQIVTEDLGAVDLLERSDAYFLPSSALDVFPPCLRTLNSHKGTYGHVTVIGGDVGYGGAAIMASEAAAKSGAGTVCLYTQLRNLTASLARNPNVMCMAVEDSSLQSTLRSDKSVLVVGPGLGRSSWSKACWQAFLGLPNYAAVVDADGLYWLGINAPTANNHLVITPHPGEAARLLGCSIDDVLGDLTCSAATLAKAYSAVVVLKGATSVIAQPNGRIVIVGAPCPALSKGGSGDVLSGMVGACLAYYQDAFEAAVIATAWHNKAALACSKKIGEVSMQPYQLLDYLE